MRASRLREVQEVALDHTAESDGGRLCISIVSLARILHCQEKCTDVDPELENEVQGPLVRAPSSLPEHRIHTGQGGTGGLSGPDPAVLKSNPLPASELRPGREVPITLRKLELRAQELQFCQDTCAPWDLDVHFSSGSGRARY